MKSILRSLAAFALIFAIVPAASAGETLDLENVKLRPEPKPDVWPFFVSVSATYDEELVEAVKLFQFRHGLPTTGLVGSMSLA